MSDTRMTQRSLPWYGISTSIVDGLQTAEEALEHADLNWDVKVVQGLYRVRLDGKDVTRKSRRRSVVRMDTGDEIGTVGSKYTAFQNRQAFSFLDKLVASDDAKFEAAGTEKNGSRVFIVMKMPQVDVVGDATSPYVLFRTAHDGSMSVTATTAAVRIQCTNMFRGIMAADAPVFKAQHLETALTDEKLQEAAERSLGIARHNIESFTETAERLAEVPVTDDEEFERLMRIAFPWENKVRDKEVAGVWDLWNTSELVPDDYRRTGWGLLNATTEFMSHERVSRSEEARYARALGVNGQIEQWLTNALLQPAS